MNQEREAALEEQSRQDESFEDDAIALPQLDPFLANLIEHIRKAVQVQREREAEERTPRRSELPMSAPTVHSPTKERVRYNLD
jgi:hypothetical protein